MTETISDTNFNTNEFGNMEVRPKRWNGIG